MEKFRYRVVLDVEIEAFDSADAWEAVQDAYGIGEDAGILVTNCKYEEKRARRRK